MQRQNDKKSFRLLFLTILFGSLFVHGAFYVLSQTVFRNWKLAHEPFHAAIEISGAIIALLVAKIILEQNSRGTGPTYGIAIAGALVGMGILDAFHAIAHVGNSFVWLHSVATFAGGVLFSLIWLPERYHRKDSKKSVILIAGFSFFLGMTSLLFPEFSLNMLSNGKFSTTALFLNLGGGVLLVLASIKLYVTYQRTQNVDDILFFLHCLLFGLAGIMFEQSQLWDFAWWGWHVLRFLAYGVALWFAIRSFQISEEQIKEREKMYIEELKNSNEDLTNFAYVASHDLRSPLRGIRHLSTWIEEDCGKILPQESLEDLHTLRGRVELLEGMLEGLLQYSKVGRDRSDSQKVQICELVEEIKELLERPESFSIVCDDKASTFICDEIALNTVLRNLIDNSIKHRERDDQTVTVRSRRAGEFIEILVSDDGPGVPPELREKVFGLFKTLKSRDEIETSGLGLAIVKKIVERQGGSIRILDTPNRKGILFSVLWPQKTATRSPALDLEKLEILR